MIETCYMTGRFPFCIIPSFNMPKKASTTQKSNETQQLKSTPATSSTDPTFSWVSRPPDLCTNPDGTICGMLQPKEGHHGIDLQLVYGSFSEKGRFGSSNGKEKYLEAKVIKNKCHGHISFSLIKLEWAHLGCKESSSKWILSLTYTQLQLGGPFL